MLSVAWSEGLTLFIFGKMSVSYSGLNSHIVCLLAALSSKNGIPWGKKAKNFWNNHDTSEYRSTLYTFWLSVPFSCSVMSHPVDCSTPGFSVHHQLPELAQTHIHQVGDAIQPSHPLPSPSPPASIFPSIRVFPNESVLWIRWLKYWSFSFSISPSNEYSGLISFRIEGLFLDSQFCSTDCVWKLTLAPYSVDSYYFVVSVEIR